METAGESKEKTTWIVQFKLSGEIWGIKFEDIQEVIEKKEITPVPKTPPFIIGIIHQRGKIITVIDFAILMGEKPPGDEESKIVYLKSDQMDVGLLVRSKMSTELIPERSLKEATLVKEDGTKEKLTLKRKLTLNNTLQLNLLEKDKVINFLKQYPFK